MRKIARLKVEEFLRKHATNSRVLDIGSGNQGGPVLKRLFPNRITIDLDPSREPDIVADAERIPFPDNSIPVVICSEMLSHARRPHVVLDEIRRVLEPGGILLLTARFVFPLNDTPVDYWRFTRYGLNLLLEKGWEITSVETDFDPFTSVAVLLQRITFQTDLAGGKVTKALIYGLLFFVSQLRHLIRRQYGDIGRRTPDDFFFSSGVFMVCRKQ